MIKIDVSANSANYAVWVGSGILDSLQASLRSLFGKQEKSLFVVTSPEIWSLWGERLLEAIAPRQPVVLFVPSGEKYKRLSEIERWGMEMSRCGADRSSLLIAFGGGVIGDMGGFLAATYMRGIDYIQVPTTLLAQVDSSVGGKTGVNLTTGKNLMGAFHHPRAVIADVKLLGTLSERELSAGIQESIKSGLIRDASLFRLIESHGAAIAERDQKTLVKIVAASIRMKSEVVGLDEKESGLRMILNFGHTMGHAIEAVTGYRAMLHGEAIAWGMLVALEMSRGRGWLTERDTERAGRVIRSFAPAALPALRPEALLAASAKDKKNRAGTRRFVLLKGIGSAVVTEDVTDTEVLAALHTIIVPAAYSRKAGREIRRGH